MGSGRAGVEADRAWTGSARALALVCGGLVAAATLLWAGSAAVWLTVALPGRPGVELAGVELTGAELSAVPGAVALLALAAVAGLVASRGPLRRGIGLLTAAAGATATVGAVRALLADRAPAGFAGSPRLPLGVPVEAVYGQPATPTPAPLLASAGAALLLAVGLFVLFRESQLVRLGARYGAARRPRGELDPDRAAWQDLDAGRDPTVDQMPHPAADRRADPA